MKNTKETNSALSADDILRKLLALHSEDLCIPECKTGSTMLSSSKPMRMDLWCMARTWSPKCFTAYEIKVSRQDWLNDQKWHKYLPYCHRMLVVCPPGIVLPNEVSEGAGLLYATSGTRFKTIVKPMHRKVTVPEDLWVYLCMHRLKLGHGTADNPKEQWLAWLRQKEENREIGREVRGKIAQRHRKMVLEVRQRQIALEKEMEELKTVKQFLVDNGLHRNMDAVFTNGYGARESIRRRLMELLPETERASMDVLHALRHAIPREQALRDSLERWHAQVDRERQTLNQKTTDETIITEAS